MNDTPDTPRWKQRFQNFEKALEKLRYAVTAHQDEPDNQLYEMALIQAFEFTYELGWKTVKDFLKNEGLNNISLPREVIKQGFHHHVIEDGQGWIEMMEDRNLMSHTYDEAKAQIAVSRITRHYLTALEQVYTYLHQRWA